MFIIFIILFVLLLLKTIESYNDNYDDKQFRSEGTCTATKSCYGNCQSFICEQGATPSMTCPPLTNLKCVTKDGTTYCRCEYLRPVQGKCPPGTKIDAYKHGTCDELLPPVATCLSKNIISTSERCIADCIDTTSKICKDPRTCLHFTCPTPFVASAHNMNIIKNMYREGLNCPSGTRQVCNTNGTQSYCACVPIMPNDDNKCPPGREITASDPMTEWCTFGKPEHALNNNPACEPNTSISKNFCGPSEKLKLFVTDTCPVGFREDSVRPSTDLSNFPLDTQKYPIVRGCIGKEESQCPIGFVAEQKRIMCCMANTVACKRCMAQEKPIICRPMDNQMLIRKK
jgi:hypothetical protein